ncbi:MAG: glycosyltransferase, partial [Ignavibacteriaceae bacterium]
VHSLWLGECALIGNILSNKFGCPHVCTLMGQDVKHSNWYLRILRNKNIKIVALSKNQSDQFNKITNKNIYKIIHWGINDQSAKNIIRDIDLLAVGSLIPLKNYSLFITLVEQITRTNKEIKCILVGSGPEELKLKQMARRKGVRSKIAFTGQLRRTEIFKLMQRSKIFIHPSKFEGAGFVFAEALVNGMNIVSFYVGYAHFHPKWFIAKDEKDFISITKKLIASELDFIPVNPFPLSETVEYYASLYGIE